MFDKPLFVLNNGIVGPFSNFIVAVLGCFMGPFYLWDEFPTPITHTLTRVREEASNHIAMYNLKITCYINSSFCLTACLKTCHVHTYNSDSSRWNTIHAQYLPV